MPRFHCSVPLSAGVSLALPPGAARHVQVLRMQPGDAITLFDGAGGEYAATVERMGRSDVAVAVGAHLPVEREAPRAVHLAVGMPANERMDWLVEKATELGVASIQPLATAHGVLRLSGERAEKKRAHWEAIAVAACEQCGRNRVPVIHPVQSFTGWLETNEASAVRLVLSLAEGTRSLADTLQAPNDQGVTVLSGPEGGLSSTEEQQAIARGFAPITLGARVLRAETAALAALVSLAGL
ncbi:16S rRNA (uracil1498-N3)-methyltransferase [Variovorax sp. YR634]|jgi:16S rRNA (uracil1498-N3)-methyltransferase|uniref:16S rRNA (uracil(1498)-N(3))-methyltransferase n=1 Tax=Variovorax TaxID=34072 RepID=UPI00089D765F|nr:MULTISPECIES: 16S rRNA (uracil(1498)-N(3))-methyltransferase [Variovorax]MDQ0081629.1 16S rRNA (uracil1498-N3)-methyltransferase [Variovorax boronicumulans]SDX68590.1 16S rRNA (uracil1498-N3)-methyltransferase [Variovorax sp. YR634]SOD22118.1 16S rRNA (uracil1498-N3)-methyltransferase [Variovorax sp. YR752]